MGFTVTDGIFTHMDRLEFTMDVTKSEGPRMTVNRGLQLPAGKRGGQGEKMGSYMTMFNEGEVGEETAGSITSCVDKRSQHIEKSEKSLKGFENVLNA